MFQIERQKHILDYIQECQTVNTVMLTEKFHVSAATIRRDIDSLAERGLIVKTHGGAVAVTHSLLNEIPYVCKTNHNQNEKRIIGKAAADLIKDNEVIILDAGSTTLEIAKNISQNNITVVTNDIKIAMELSDKTNVTVHVCGGKLQKSVYTLLGNDTAAYFSKLHVNKSFMGCDAIDVDFGVSNRTAEEAFIKVAMMKASDEVIMVTDSSKLNKKVFYYVCDISSINKLIIDKIDDESRKLLQEKGIEIIVAGKPDSK